METISSNGFKIYTGEPEWYNGTGGEEDAIFKF